MRPSRLPLALALALVALAACGDDASSPADDGTTDTGVTDTATGGDASGDTGSTEGPTWHSAVAPLVAQHCGSCHVEGGAAPFTLTSADDWAVWGPAAMASVDAGRMPPWMPDDECRTYEHSRRMPQADIDTLRAWIDADQPLGNAASAAPIPEPDRIAFEPTHSATISAAYTPSIETADDYRCFILDLEIDETMYMTGSQVVPGNGLVHHVLVYALTDAGAEDAIALDAAEDGPGYTCFGGPLPFGNEDEGGGGLDPEAIGERIAAIGDFPNQIGAWVPGIQPNVAPEGMATRIDAGSRIVMQVHYSAVAGDVTFDDGTRFEAALTTEAPDYLRQTRPLAIRQLDIPAGEPAAAHEASFPYYGAEPLQVRGVTAHMHLLGKQISVNLDHEDATRTCGLDIPDWDFNWQQGYTMLEGDDLMVADGDQVTLRCVYDNSEANQPVVNGETIEPRDVTWGDGTLDEMCLAYLDTVRPYVPENPDGACPASCGETCDGDPACLMACAGSDFGCIGCQIEQYFGCGGQACLLGMFASDRACFTRCASSTVMLGGDLAACMEAECGDTYSQLTTCLGDAAADGACDEGLATCGL